MRGWGRAADYEKVFADFFGVRKVLWLGQGIAGDDTTHGHIDDLARFVGQAIVAAVVEKNPGDPKAGDFQGQCLPASYANFYMVNDRVLVPTFNDPQALGILADLFPG